MEKYKKINDNQVEVETTTVSTSIISIDDLNTQVKNYQGYIVDITNESNAKVASLQSQIEVLQERIKQFKDLGVMTQEESNLQPIQEVIEAQSTNLN